MNLNFLKIDEVYTFKLNSGEELIAKVKGTEVDHIIVEEAVSIAPGPQGMNLIPSIFTANPRNLARLNTNSVTLVTETNESIKTKYIEATTGLTVPDKKIVMG